MNFGFLKENTEIFGLDIGTSAIRIVQLKKSFGKFELVSFGSAPVPNNISISDSKIDQESLARIIKELVHSSRIITKKAVTGLSGDSVFTTVIKMPKMPLSELEKAVRYQAEQNIPLKISEVRIDWQIVSESADKREVSVMIIAAPKAKIEKVLSVVEMAGLDLNVLEINSFASARSLQSTEPLYMIMNIGGSTTELSIVDNGIVGHTRSMPLGGIAMTRAIAQNLSMDETQAEQFKRKFGISKDKLEGQIIKAIHPILANLTEEIERSIKYYSEQTGKTVTLVKLTGGTSKMIGFQDFLSEQLGLGIVYGNPWASVVYRNDIANQLAQNAPDFSVAVGLAMREV